MSHPIIELINVNRDVTWLTWAVLYFFLIGLSIGGTLLSLPAFVFGSKKLKSLGRVALIVAVTTGMSAPIALVADLHQPARFYHFYLYFTPGSWMSWGAFFLPVYIMALSGYAFLAFKPGKAPAGALLPVAGLLTTLGAMLVALYTGNEMGVLDSRTLWSTPWLISQYLITGLSGASGLALLLNRYSDYDPDCALQLKKSLFGFLAIGILMQLAWMLSGNLDPSGSGASFLRLAKEYTPISVIFLGLLLGGILPLLLTLSATSKGTLAGALALFGAWMLRWNMFIGGQRIPKNNAGFYDYSLPLGSEGLTGIVGTLGLWVLILLLLTTLLRYWQARESQI